MELMAEIGTTSIQLLAILGALVSIEYERAKITSNNQASSVTNDK